jgi:hypothetical protein
MSGFVVDSRTLAAVRDTLGRLHDQLVGMHTVIWHEWGTLGGHALESELEHFCGTWHYGVSELGGQLQDLTRRLGEAAAAYERIEERIMHAGSGAGSGTGGAAVSPTGSGPGISRHHPAAHGSSGQHAAGHSPPKHHPAQGTHYSGGAPLAPGNTSTHSGDKHSKGEKDPGEGSGTTVIGGGPERGGGGARHGGGPQHGDGSEPGAATHHPSGGSGSGITVIGGGATQSRGSGSGSGTTTIDEKISHAEERQRAELASVRHMVKG